MNLLHAESSDPNCCIGSSPFPVQILEGAALDAHMQYTRAQVHSTAWWGAEKNMVLEAQ